MSQARKDWGKGAAIAGLIGGGVLLVYTAAISVLLVRPGAGPLLDRLETAVGFGGGSMMVGLGLHFLVAVAWAIPIAALLRNAPKVTINVAGTLFAIVIWVVMYRMVLPAADLQAFADALPIWSTMIGCALYATTMSIAFMPWMTEGETPHAEERLPAATAYQPPRAIATSVQSSGRSG
jgi:hypothetical protein